MRHTETQRVTNRHRLTDRERGGERLYSYCKTRERKDRRDCVFVCVTVEGMGPRIKMRVSCSKRKEK